MANNKIQVKRTNVSGRTANVSSSGNSQYIDAGEFALNMADGILYSSNGSALITVGANQANQRITNTLTLGNSSVNATVNSTAFTGSANAATYLGSSINSGNSTGIFTTGVVNASGIVSGSELTSTLASGDEGGQVNLAKPPNANTDGGVTIDAYQNKLRIFEQGGSARGVYIDLTAASAGVGTNLLAAAGSGTVTSVGSANGIAGGPITGSGTLYAVAGNNTVFVNASGIHVNTSSLPTVNLNSQYVWTNTQTFQANISFTGNNISLVSNTGSIFFAGSSDANWRIGRNTGGTTKYYYSNNTLDIIAANSNLEGIVFGWTGNSYLETGYAGTFTQNPIYVGNSSVNVSINSTAFTGTANNANYVKANNGITSNSSGVFVTQGDGTTVNSTGVHVRAGNTQLISNSTGVWANQANFDHNSLSNYDANKHVDHTSVTLTAGAGLTGGGTIAASRTFDVGAGNGISVAADAVAVSGGNTLTVNSTGVHVNSTLQLTTLTTSGNVVVEGNLTVSGNVTVIGANNLSIVDNFIYLNSNNTTQNIDLGFAGNYNDGTYKHAGFFRDASDGFWKPFDGYTPEPDAAVDIDTSNNSFNIAGMWFSNTRIGNTTVYATINSTAYSGSANSATYANSSVTNTFTVGTASYFVSNGNLGVSNSAPAHKLRVEGTTSLAGAVSDITTLAAGNTTITGFANISGNVIVGSTSTGGSKLSIGSAPISTATFKVNTDITIDNNYAATDIDLYVQNTALTVARVYQAEATGITNLSQNKDSNGTNLGTDMYGKWTILTNGDASSPAVDARIDSALGAFYDVRNYSSGATSNTIDVAYGVQAAVRTFAGGNITTAYGIRSLVYPATANATVTGNVGTAFAYSGIIGLNSGNASVGTGYLYHGTYSTSANVTGVKYGLYLTNETINYLSGNLGIGTASPKSQLHVYGTNQTTANLADGGNLGGSIRLSDTGAAAGSGGAVIFTNVQGDTANSAGFAAIKGLLVSGGGNTTGTIAFSTRNATTDAALTERMRIDSSGNVGIGNTAPNAKLQVTGTANVSGNVAIDGITTFSANVILGSSGLSANGGFGTSGHSLHSNGTATYWAADDQGVTSVSAGNGIISSTGGAITATGTLYVDGANGISIDASGVNVLVGNTQLISNSTGVWANQANFSHDLLSGFVADEHVAHSTVSISPGSGLTGGGTIAASRTLTVLANTGIVANATGVYANAAYIQSVNFPDGTAMFFAQATPPTGWTQSTALNNAGLRLVSGATGGTTGGTQNFGALLNGTTTVSGTTDGTTLANNTSAIHSHRISTTFGSPGFYSDFTFSTTGLANVTTTAATTRNRATDTSGGGGSHNHTYSSTFSFDIKYIDVILCTKN